MSIYQVIQILKTNCETIKTVHLVYNDKVTISYKKITLNRKTISIKFLIKKKGATKL
jgi:plasmid replication initiation protein